MPSLKLSFLGSPQVELDGQPVQIERRKALALLAYLAVTGEACAREALATLLWPEHDSARALAYLRRTLWELNAALGMALSLGGPANARAGFTATSAGIVSPSARSNKNSAVRP